MRGFYEGGWVACVVVSWRRSCLSDPLSFLSLSYHRLRARLRGTALVVATACRSSHRAHATAPADLDRAPRRLPRASGGFLRRAQQVIRGRTAVTLDECDAARAARGVQTRGDHRLRRARRREAAVINYLLDLVTGGFPDGWPGEGQGCGRRAAGSGGIWLRARPDRRHRGPPRRRAAPRSPYRRCTRPRLEALAARPRGA